MPLIKKQKQLRIKEKQVDALNTLKSDNNKKLEIKNENIIPESAFASDEAREKINKNFENRTKCRQRKNSL